MKKNRILVDKGSIFICSVYFVFNILLCSLSIYYGLTLDNKVAQTFMIIIVVIFMLIFISVCFFTNRSANFIYYYDNKLERRGFLFGFKKTIAVSNIKRISKVTLHLDNTYYLLVDGVSNEIERIKDDSAIFIPYTKEGKNFIKQFWEGEIPK